ncbi:hypothetical protein PDE_03006 [Penicillium oxalicum 114-2]|uniref:Uncharacterized protein n=1 Tax=Penicillium oxalicum (strain 114-2 / CGMCC 5302) TaxID=933388 RepID=S7ZBS6_PENO1|nr:hypothetical protein PDE_03006 [Penicillium oxalicum 114-2]
MSVERTLYANGFHGDTGSFGSRSSRYERPHPFGGSITWQSDLPREGLRSSKTQPRGRKKERYVEESIPSNTHTDAYLLNGESQSSGLCVAPSQDTCRGELMPSQSK